MNTAPKFKKRFGNRLVELDFDHKIGEYQQLINDFFNKHIEHKFEDNTGGQQTYHLDYGDLSQMKEWIWLANTFGAF